MLDALDNGVHYRIDPLLVAIRMHYVTKITRLGDLEATSILSISRPHLLDTPKICPVVVNYFH